MYCIESSESIKKEDIEFIISMLRSEEPYIMTQTIRFCQALCKNPDNYKYIDKDLANILTMIFENSVIKELLSVALEFVGYWNQEQVKFPK